MAQNSFGRRHTPSQAGAASAVTSVGRTGSEDGSSRAVVLSSAAASFLAFAALGYVLTPSTTSPVEMVPSAPEIADTRPAPVECRGEPGCKNEYSVELRCGESAEPKVTSVVAADAEAASSTAERYNRGCSTRRTSFIAVITPGTSSASRMAANTSAAKATGQARSSSGGRRFRRR